MRAWSGLVDGTPSTNTPQSGLFLRAGQPSGPPTSQSSAQAVPWGEPHDFLGEAASAEGAAVNHWQPRRKQPRADASSRVKDLRRAPTASASAHIPTPQARPIGREQLQLVSSGPVRPGPPQGLCTCFPPCP